MSWGINNEDTTGSADQFGIRLAYFFKTLKFACSRRITDSDTDL